MAQSIVFNGIAYSVPDTGDEDWGTNLTDYFVAIPQGALQKTGGLFTLTADANFGVGFGLVALYLKSTSSNLATAGIIRLARTDSIAWRNVANGANLLLTVDGSNNLTFNGTVVLLSGLIVNADIAVGAAIARSKLASGTASHVLINDGSGVMSSEATLAKVRGGSGQDNSSLTFPASGTVQATTPNNHGVLVSGSGATATVIAPNASTAFPLVSGGSSADPTWAKLTEAGGGTNQSTYATGDILYASASNTLSKLAAGSNGQILKLASGVPSWANEGAAAVPTIQKFTSGSGTYTTAANARWIRVRMVGGGGGGGGSSTTVAGNGSDGGAGGNTTFGTTLLVANGGAAGGGGATNDPGGAGGTASLGTGPIGLALSGGSGTGATQSGSTANISTPGGNGGNSIFGGGGGGGSGGTPAGLVGVTNSGGGGGGACGGGAGISGSGGGAGGGVDALIISPSATYSYAVGAAGSSGAAGTGGAAGGTGGSGIIIVEEYY
jgi:hypothetical protein